MTNWRIDIYSDFEGVNPYMRNRGFPEILNNVQPYRLYTVCRVVRGKEYRL